MQVIYRWAFVVAPAVCPFLPPTLKSGGARAPREYMAPAPMPPTSQMWLPTAKTKLELIRPVSIAAKKKLFISNI